MVELAFGGILKVDFREGTLRLAGMSERVWARSDGSHQEEAVSYRNS
jgi:hypothetical protein